MCEKGNVEKGYETQKSDSRYGETLGCDRMATLKKK